MWISPRPKLRGWRSELDHRTLLKTGVAGSVIALLCCVTPIAIWILSGFGLAALAYLVEPVALVALAGFLGLTGYALWRRSMLK